jgi:hypothetical protein
VITLSAQSALQAFRLGLQQQQVKESLKVIDLIIFCQIGNIIMNPILEEMLFSSHLSIN